MEQPFSEAVKLFRDGKLQKAAEAFSRLAAATPPHQYSSASCIMAAKAWNGVDKPDKAYAAIEQFRAAFPDSRYAADAVYERAVSEMLLGRYVAALLGFENTRNLVAGTPTAARAGELIDYVAAQRIQTQDLDAFPADSVGVKMKHTAMLALARRSYRTGKFTDARTLVDRLLSDQPSASIAVSAEELRSQIASGVNIHIGVVLPLAAGDPGGFGQQGSDILNGVKFALETRKKEMPAGMSVVLDIHDSGKEPEKAKEIVSGLAAKTDVIGVIGPMFSSGVIASAPIAAVDTLPLISPTANAVGTAGAGSTVFQLNPDLAMHGRAMATYAVKEGGLKTLAILASSDPGLKPLVESFYSEVKTLGGKILAVEFYNDASADLDQNCVHIRKIGIGGPAKINFGKLNRDQANGLKSRGISPSLVDDLRRKKGEMDLLDLLGPYGALVAETLHIPVAYPPVSVRDQSKPVESLDAVYAPITTVETIPVLLSQYAYYNIGARLLGNAEWNNASALEANKHAAQGVTFCSETYVDKDDPSVQQFGSLYYRSMQTSPNRYAMFGYDAVNIILEQIVKGVNTRSGLAAALSEPRKVQGVHSALTLGPSRANATLNIIRYSGSSLKRVAVVSGE